MAQLNPQSSLQLPVQKEPGAPELSSSPATASLIEFFVCEPDSCDTE